MKLYASSLFLVLLASHTTNADGADNNNKNLRARDLNNIFDDNDSKNKPASNGAGVTNLTPQPIPSVDRAAVAAEDEANDAFKDRPARFAIVNQVNVTPETDGEWSAAEDGTMIWQHRVKSPGCNSLNFGFTKYVMPEGGSLHIYDVKGRSAISRPFTSDDNSKAQELWTPVLESCDAIIEVNLDSSTNKEDLQLTLTNVNVGYRGFGTRHESEHGKPQKRRELSGSCNVDVVCPEGDGWELEIASVAVYSTGGGLFCTGALINDAESTGTPHFLTANHCGINNNNAPSLVTYWNYESSTCVPGSTSGDGPLTMFNTGATHLVSSSASDVTLVRLNDPPNPDYGVTYAGWDRSGADATTAVAIHHPSCDEKRISFEYDLTAISSYGGNAGSGDTHVRVDDWDIGTTEPGSSGSPLFDQNHRVIGQLHGGSAACGNNLEDYYGRFFKSWDAGLKDHLDPNNTGRITVDTFTGASLAPTITPKPTESPTTPPPTQAPTTLSSCLGDPTNVAVVVDILTDDYPQETSYTLTDNNSGVVRSGGGFTAPATLYTKTLCVPGNTPYTFTIFDSYGDGIYSSRYGFGSYTVSSNSVVYAEGGEFGSSESTTFTLPTTFEGSPEPSRSPTPPPTPAPVTPQPTNAPVTPQPTNAPVTPSPTKTPTSPPTDAPVTPSPTDAPTQCTLGKWENNDRCNDFGVGDAGCCSGLCESSGNPAGRKCLPGAGETFAPTPSQQNSPEPTRDCIERNGLCSAGTCCNYCKNNGKCA